VTPATDKFGALFTARFDTSAPIEVANVQVGGDNGDPVHLTWDVHPNESVEYYIYRKIKHNGVMGSPVYLSTLSHSTSSYDDPDYAVAGSSPDRLYYDVRAHHVPSNTFAQQSWVGGILGEIQETKQRETLDTLGVQKPAYTAYGLHVYPNPFNPTTTLDYQLVSDGYVTIQVLDVLGREIAELVSALRAPGRYSAKWNASSFASGIYFVRLSVLDALGHLKYRQVTKVLLSR
jgi:hypothetical protein